MNTIFQGSEPVRLNACVGNNGSINYYDYAEGFSLAANALLDKVIQGEGIHSSPDYYVYPICFNMRHSIELRLKGAIEELAKAAKLVGKRLLHEKYSMLPEKGKINIIYVHNIKAIWDFFKTNALTLDGRFKYIISDLEKHILDIADIDPTGQTFRYPISKESKRHLTDIGGLINCRILKCEFEILHKNLDRLFHFTQDILDEYNLSSVRDNISRLELNLIALHFKNVTSSEDFKTTKLEARKKFNLSSRKLDSALERIKSHYEFSKIVGISNNLLGITEEQLTEVMRYWVEQNPSIYKAKDAAPAIYRISDIDFEEARTSRKKLNLMLKQLKDKISSRYSAGFRALFYFSRDGIDYSERYQEHFSLEVKQTGQSSEKTFMHVFKKTTFLENTLISLFYLGFDTLAFKLIKTLELHTSNIDIPLIISASQNSKKSLIGEYSSMYLKDLDLIQNKE